MTRNKMINHTAGTFSAQYRFFLGSVAMTRTNKKYFLGALFFTCIRLANFSISQISVCVAATGVQPVGQPVPPNRQQTHCDSSYVLQTHANLATLFTFSFRYYTHLDFTTSTLLLLNYSL
ncbi:hypothetical protein BT96DRAFT_82092 [Gymnopus androsaceus JB14]|uniref:Uncharacterized protein n=1 Tax=Gymnopus androsaceus JB14 TaxID=1447944 RepID=A0A6A4ICG9_9AGAR|nr:hypothetical protein BT96DRAFT_82092 [Gymnopus androsaceus JB14]